MSKLTITEALQEIKTINKRIEKKREGVSQYLVRDIRARDPLEKDGGSEKFIREEFQSIRDLNERIVDIRMAIQKSNFESSLTVNEQTRTVSEWLTWRREIAPGLKTFNSQLLNGIKVFKNETIKKGGKVIAANAVQINESYSQNDPPAMVVNFDELATVKYTEELEEILGSLDGKLSLFNAMTVIEI